MRTLDIRQATAPLAEYAKAINGEPIVLTSEGKPVAALVSIQNADWETISLSLNPDFIKLIEESRARQSADGGISSGEMRRRLGKK